MGHTDGVYRLLGTTGTSKSMPGHVRVLHLPQSCVHTRCGCSRCRVICERWFRSVRDVLSAYLSGTEGVKPPAVQGGLGCSLAFLSAI